MPTVLRDLRYACRTWRRTPGPIAAALAALALGIGANTTIFSIVSTVLLRPLPYDHPERLVMVWQDMRARGGPEHEWASPGLFVEWQQRASIFEALAAVRPWMPTLTGVAEPERLRGAAVSASYFTALGVSPAKGRWFTADEDRAGGSPLAVISDGLWRRSFGADPAIVGRVVTLDGRPTTIVGVMPASFDPPIATVAELWAPIRIDPARASRGMIVLRVLGKLREGVTQDQAKAAMAAIAERLGQEDPEWERARIALVPLHEDVVGSVRPMLIVLSATVAVVLCIACANVMSLLLARASDRAREMTIRAALGADRRHIVRQLLTESAALTVLGAAMGVLLAWWCLAALLAIAPPSAPRLQEVRIDVSVLAFTAAITILAAVAGGLAPAFAAARTSMTSRLRDGGRETTGTNRVRAAIVAVEIALAVVLVVGAALLVRSLIALQRVDMGFRGDHLLTAAIAPQRGRYPDAAAVRQFQARLLERAGTLPGVQHTALTSVLPLSGVDMDLTFQIRGRPPAASPGDAPTAWTRIITPSYLAALGIRMIQGRAFGALDTTSAPGAVLVNETLARRYWPGQTPLGAKVQVEGLDATVVGVVADVRHRGPGTDPEAEMYLSSAQFDPRGPAVLVLRTSGDPSAVTPALRSVLREIDSSLPLSNVFTMDQLMERSTAQPRFLATLMTGFALLAAALALVGVYGLLSFTVSRRVREIGVRLALGATPRRVLAGVIGRTALVVTIGVVAGSVLAAALSRVLRTLLFAVTPGDPATLLAMAAAVTVASLAASLPPAWRAARTDPVRALRED